MQRLVDFGKTASSKLTVDEFNKIDLEEEADPPSFTKARQRAKQAQIYDETVKCAAPELLAQLASTQERVEEVLAKRKVIEEDIADRATVLPTTEERKKMLQSRLPVLTLNLMQESSSRNVKDAAVKPGSSYNCSNEDDTFGSLVATQSKESLAKQDSDNTAEGISQNEIKEKELLDTISLFNETQQYFENEEDGDDDDNDKNDDSLDDGCNARQQDGIVKKNEGE